MKINFNSVIKAKDQWLEENGATKESIEAKKDEDDFGESIEVLKQFEEAYGPSKE